MDYQSSDARCGYPMFNGRRSMQGTQVETGHGKADEGGGSSVGGSRALSQLQCETAQYIADLTESLGAMARQSGLTTLTALLNVIAREAEMVGRSDLAA